MNTPWPRTAAGIDELVAVLVTADAGRHDLWAFVALGLARAAAHVGGPFELLGQRWDTVDAHKILDLVRDGNVLDTVDLIRWQAENIIESASGDTLTCEQVAGLAGVAVPTAGQSLEWLADQGRICRDGAAYRY